MSGTEFSEGAGLPDGWVRVRLGDVLDTIEAGKSFTCEPRPAEPEEWGIVKVSAMTYGRFDEAENKAVPAGVAVNPTYEISPGDVLVSRANTRAYVGAPVLVGDCRPRLLLSDKSLRLVPNRAVDKRWLVYALRSPQVRAYIEAKASGTKDSMRNISQGALKSMPLMLPPVAEQVRIVEALEVHLSHLSAASGLAVKSMAKLQALRSAITQEALSACAAYPTFPLGDLLREPLRNGHSARATDRENGIRTLTLTAVTLNDFDDKHTKVTAANPVKVSNLWLEPGDILIQRSNTPDLVGTAALFNGPSKWAIYPDLLIRVRTAECLLPEFATLVLQSRRTRRYFKARAKGLAGSMPKIDQDTISGVEMQVPPLDVQHKVIQETQERLAQVYLLESPLSVAVRRGDNLRSGLLRRAFSGRLVPQNPDDEPAAAVLDRIRTERAAHPKPKRTRKVPAASKAAETTPAPEPTEAPRTSVQQEFPL
ncbi:restriction endonuclease subunit S [Streptomyces sp. NPDC093991]|uniref:restriction endonuclease subunit S n=1 Tax=unclassified Streptomyces TaxID=2593676 RepID=UPI0034191C37